MSAIRIGNVLIAYTDTLPVQSECVPTVSVCLKIPVPIWYMVRSYCFRVNALGDQVSILVLIVILR
jgi:hypothetical protein